MEELRALKIPSEIMGSEPYSLDNLRHLEKYTDERFSNAIKIFDEIVGKAMREGYSLIFYRLDSQVMGKCLICGKWLFSIEEIKSHFSKHEGYEYNSTLEAFIEVRSIESIEIFECKACRSCFVSKGDVLTHIEANHKGKSNVKREPKDDEIVEFKVKDGLPKWILDHEIELSDDEKVKIGDRTTHKLPYRVAKGLELFGIGKVIKNEGA